MKEFEIWIEGYSATGESAPAMFIGKCVASTFKEACETFIDDKGQNLPLDVNRQHPSIWCCRLFDNEQDARKSFG